MSDILQAAGMFTTGGLLALGAWRIIHALNVSEAAELQRMIDGQPKARRAWERREPEPERLQEPSRRYAFSVPSATAPETRTIPARGNASAPGPWTVEREQPIRPPTGESDVLVPMGQAAITSALATVLLVSIALLGLRLPWQDVARAAGIVAPSVALVTWLWRVNLFTALLTSFERVIGQDLNHDGSIGRAPHLVLLDPEKARAGIQTERRQTDGGGELAELMTFTDRCFTTGTSEGAHGVKSTAQRRRYTQNRDLLMALGLADWKDDNKPTAGWVMTTSRERARRVLAEHVGEI